MQPRRLPRIPLRITQAQRTTVANAIETNLRLQEIARQKGFTSKLATYLSASVRDARSHEIGFSRWMEHNKVHIHNLNHQLRLQGEAPIDRKRIQAIYLFSKSQARQ